MSNCRVLCMLAIVTALLSITTVEGGPIRSLVSLMSNPRQVKIPRAIRAPFRNNEMMTARGFGKRSQQVKDADTEIPWSIDKFDAQDGPSADNNEPTRKLLNAEFDESYPIELIVQEMTGNAAFLRSILERCVDTNHNGQITLRELFSGVATPIANEMI